MKIIELLEAKKDVTPLSDLNNRTFTYRVKEIGPVDFKVKKVEITHVSNRTNVFHDMHADPEVRKEIVQKTPLVVSASANIYLTPTFMTSKTSLKTDASTDERIAFIHRKLLRAHFYPNETGNNLTKTEAQLFLKKYWHPYGSDGYEGQVAFINAMKPIWPPEILEMSFTEAMAQGPGMLNVYVKFKERL